MRVVVVGKKIPDSDEGDEIGRRRKEAEADPIVVGNPPEIANHRLPFRLAFRFFHSHQALFRGHVAAVQRTPVRYYVTLVPFEGLLKNRAASCLVGEDLGSRGTFASLILSK